MLGNALEHAWADFDVVMEAEHILPGPGTATFGIRRPRTCGRTSPRQVRAPSGREAQEARRRGSIRRRDSDAPGVFPVANPGRQGNYASGSNLTLSAID